MTRILAVPIVALPLLLSGCAALTQATDTICTKIAALPPVAVAALDAQDPHGVIGNIWAHQKSACINGVPAPGVSGSWAAMLWGELKVLIPQVLPYLVPMLFGLL